MKTTTGNRIRRAASVAFWAGVPAAVAMILFWPRGSVLYVGEDSFSLGLNTVQSSLPPPLGEIWYFYPATLFAVAVLAAAAAARWWGWVDASRASVWLPTYYLPVYVAGFESTQLVAWSMRCHSLTAPRSPLEVITSGAFLSGVAFLATVSAGAVAARLGGHRSRLWAPVPAVVWAILGATAMPWLLLWHLVSSQ